MASTGMNDRAAGTLVGLAVGDALGAGYEFAPPLADDRPVLMLPAAANGNAAGGWTDDTSMAIVVTQAAAAARGNLLADSTLDEIVTHWELWARTSPDVGIQTRQVLREVRDHPTAAAAREAVAALHERTGRTSGNGSLMRTAPVALAYLHDAAQREAAAHAVSSLTHFDREAGEACALWCHAIAYAVQHASFDGLDLAVESLPADRRDFWSARLREAELVDPPAIANNGWSVAALQAAWSAIRRTPDSDPTHFARAVEKAVRCGNDTDTVAAIAGSLLGARWGVSAIPLAWQRVLHGWPEWRARDLTAHAIYLADGCAGQWPAPQHWDYTAFQGTGALAVHPHDPGVMLSGVDHVRSLPPGVDAVVSLCRLGSDEVPAASVAATDHVEVWLIDSSKPAENAHLDQVLIDAADTVAALRAEGRHVLLHCVQAQSRTPTVATLYATRHCGASPVTALDEVCQALPQAHPNAAFRDALRRLGGTL